MQPFSINFLDHVAIQVKDMTTTIAWYKKVLGLTACRKEEWGEYPVFLLTGKTGVAVFPADASLPTYPPNSKHVKIEHFAFNVNSEAFQQAQEHFTAIGVPFEWKDHTFFHSVYVKDPDEHTVELTTLVVNESSFYPPNQSAITA
jgi:catechol 2,3-dioxygenase-like lactoylglutathione lyase family enzyme